MDLAGHEGYVETALQGIQTPAYTILTGWQQELPIAQEALGLAALAT